MITKDTRKDFQGEMADGTYILYPFFLKLTKMTTEGFFKSSPSKAQQMVAPKEGKDGVEHRTRTKGVESLRLRGCASLKECVEEAGCREENPVLALQIRRPAHPLDCGSRKGDPGLHLAPWKETENEAVRGVDGGSFWAADCEAGGVWQSAIFQNKPSRLLNL